MLDPRLLEILVCPCCKGELTLSSDEGWLLCRQCGIRYPVREGIPILLVNEAQPIPPSAGGEP